MGLSFQALGKEGLEPAGSWDLGPRSLTKLTPLSNPQRTRDDAHIWDGLKHMFGIPWRLLSNAPNWDKVLAALVLGLGLRGHWLWGPLW